MALPPTAELRRRIEALAVLPERVDNLVQSHNEMLTLLRALAATVERLEQKQETLDNPENESEHNILAELEEQRRLNAYLKGEIVRRDLEAEAVKQPWWEFWRRR